MEGSATCNKVRFVNHALFADLATILLDVYPTTSAAYIQLAINNAYCAIPTRAVAVNPQADEDEEEDKSHWFVNHSSFDRYAYYAAFDEIRDELTRTEYKAFYEAYHKWQKANSRDWWVDEMWREGIRVAFCKVKP